MAVASAAHAAYPLVYVRPAWPSARSPYKILHHFTGRSGRGGTDGAEPWAGLIDVSGELYGTTSAGGAYTSQEFFNGTVFAISTTGTERVIHSFGYATDGYLPPSGLVDLNGDLYGTTTFGGTHNFGTVFKIDRSGAESVVYNFTGVDGADPGAGLIAVNGELYGTTQYSGENDNGTIFKLSPSGSLRVLYNFPYYTDGIATGNLIYLNGELYGTTTKYGDIQGPVIGTVFAISTTTGRYRVVHYFFDRDPVAGLVDLNGELYGVTYNGGAYNAGSVFKISTSGAESDVYDFKGGSDGEAPLAPLIAVNGELYGTTTSGGTYSGGTLFKVSRSGAESVLHSFGANLGNGEPDGNYPYAPLLYVDLGHEQELYGTTEYGGIRGYGTVFSYCIGGRR